MKVEFKNWPQKHFFKNVLMAKKFKLNNLMILKFESSQLEHGIKFDRSKLYMDFL